MIVRVRIAWLDLERSRRGSGRIVIEREEGRGGEEEVSEGVVERMVRSDR